jgi:hypothetical protein
MPDPAPRWAPLKQAAAENGIHYRTLLYWIKHGLIQAHRFGPKLLQVDLNDLDAMRVPVEPTGPRRAS